MTATTGNDKVIFKDSSRYNNVIKIECTNRNLIAYQNIKAFIYDEEGKKQRIRSGAGPPINLTRLLGIYHESCASYNAHGKIFDQFVEVELKTQTSGRTII